METKELANIAAGTYSYINVKNSATLVASGLDGDVNVQIAADGGWVNVTDSAGTVQKLNATIQTLSLVSPGVYSISNSTATTGKVIAVQ